jgi:RNAse (barnase) inhibitor barstar
MVIYTFKAKKLITWSSFHKEFMEVMNFPDYYGKNMDAWIDCMDELCDQGTIALYIKNGKLLKDQSPEIFSALLECSAFVNFRRIELGEKPELMIAIN